MRGIKIKNTLKKTIYLIRHGETDFNKMGLVQGSGIDAPLNDLGKAQAKAFFEAYKNIAFDKIYTSKLIRTQQSVQCFIDAGIPFESYEGLNEMCWGVMEGKIPNYMQDERFLGFINAWKNGETHLTVDGGESPQQVAERQKPVMDLMLYRIEEKTILIAMHGRAIRILLTQMLQKPLSDMDSFEHQNLCLYQLEYDYDTKSFELLLSNDVRHLAIK